MEPVVTQDPVTGAWTVVTQDGNRTITTRFTADWTFTGATEVDRPNATTVTTMEFNASYVMTGAISVITEGGFITTRTFDGNWNVISETTVPETDPALPVITISDAAAVTEGGALSYTISLDKAATTDVTVTVSAAGSTATDGTDFTLPSTTVTIPSGQTSVTFLVNTIDDQNQESLEAVALQLSNPSGATLGAKTSATGTILDNDAPPADLPTISIANAPDVTEGGDAVFTITLSKASDTPVTVNYVTVGGDAQDGDDYTGSQGTITIPAGQTSITLSIATINDSTYESRPETFSVSLSDPVGATLYKDGAFVRILDNDPAPVLPTISISDAPTVTEGGLMTFTVTLSAAQTSPVTVEYWSSISTPDYTSAAGVLTFDPGQTTKTISIQTNPDTEVEQNETVTMNLQAPSGATISRAVATGIISDGPPVSNLPTISINDITVDENGRAIFTVSMSKPWSETVEVRYATENGTALNGADYIAKEGVIRFFPGNSLTTSVVVQLQNDGNSEPVETMKVNLSNPVNATIAKATGTLTINDDDAGAPAPPAGSPFTAIATGQIRDDLSNGAGPDSIDNLTSTLTTFQRASTNEETRGALEFDLSSVTGTITSAVLRVSMEYVWDSPEQMKAYVYTGNGQVTQADWNAGTEAGAANFTTSGSQGRAFADITLDAATVQAAKANGGIVGIVFRADGLESAAEGGASFYRDGATLFIDSQETPPPPAPTVTIDDATVDEGGVATFTVTLSAPANGPVTVDYATNTTGGTASPNDFTAANGTVTFAAGETSKLITVQTTQDGNVEPDETFAVALSAPSGATLGAKATGIGTILNEDQAPLPTLSVSDVTVIEGGNAVVEVRLSGSATGPVTVAYATTAGTASQADFVAASGSLTFAAGETVKQVTIATINDSSVEANESFNFNITNPTGATIADSQGVITITDNDTAITINGTAAANTLNGTAANEIINGLGGNDTINGGAGDDQLNGGAGADWLRGGVGNDTLTGGGGTDRFIFDTAPAAGNVDTITDIDLATEALFLENAIFNVGRPNASATNPLVLQATFFRAGSALDADDRILYDTATGTVSYDADGNGSAAPVAFAKVNPGTILSQADFYVI